MPNLSWREIEGQRFLYSLGRRGAVVKCLTCEHEHVVDRDEDGHACIYQEPCHDGTCTKMLCCECGRFSCDACGLTHCLEHRVDFGDLKLCPVCMVVLRAVEYAEREREESETAEVAAWTRIASDNTGWK